LLLNNLVTQNWVDEQWSNDAAIKNDDGMINNQLCINRALVDERWDASFALRMLPASGQPSPGDECYTTLLHCSFLPMATIIIGTTMIPSMGTGHTNQDTTNI
jgi:hypothetical protein